MAEALAAIGGVAAVLELGKAASALAKTLYTLYRSSKLVNDTINELAVEVDSLGKTCAHVHNLLVSLEKEHNVKDEGQDWQYASLWDCVADQVTDCIRTISTLSKSIEGIQRDRTTFLAQASRQIRLSLKKDEIAEIRGRIRMHMSCLQVTLQSVNM